LKVPKTKAIKQAADAFEQPMDTVVDGIKTALRTKRSDVTPPRKNNVMPLYTVPSGIPGTDNGRNAQDPAALAEPPRQTKNWDHLNMLFG
ncbi:MAG: hypothetical protein KKF21_19785, partial [Bacteroidetes bacterium]|nr:hypothetical protein [Bacteroidota bacterium]